MFSDEMIPALFFVATCFTIWALWLGFWEIVLPRLVLLCLGVLLRLGLIE